MDPTPEENPQPGNDPLPGEAHSDSQESEGPLREYHSGNGKIARLPDEIRDKVNQMLVDGIRYKEILERIGEHAKGITADHISTWKINGGFQRWLEHRDTKTGIRITRSEAIDLATEKPAAPLQEASRSLASAQIYDLLRLFDTTALRSALANKPELYLQLISSISRLSEAEAACAHRQVQQALAQLKLEQAKAVDAAIDPKKMYTGAQTLEILRHIKIL